MNTRTVFSPDSPPTFTTTEHLCPMCGVWLNIKLYRDHLVPIYGEALADRIIEHLPKEWQR